MHLGINRVVASGIVHHGLQHQPLIRPAVGAAGRVQSRGRGHTDDGTLAADRGVAVVHSILRSVFGDLRSPNLVAGVICCDGSNGRPSWSVVIRKHSWNRNPVNKIRAANPRDARTTAIHVKPASFLYDSRITHVLKNSGWASGGRISPLNVRCLQLW